MSETTNKQFLDKDGLVALWNKIITSFSTKLEEFYNKTTVQFGGEHQHEVTFSVDATPELQASRSNGVLTLYGATKVVNIDTATTSNGEHSHALYSDDYGAGQNPEDWFINPEDMDNLFNK